MKIDAIILAGGGKDALLGIGGQTMLECVLRAFQGAALVGRIGVVGCKDFLQPVLDRYPEVALFPPGDTVLESVASGLNGLRPEKWVLISASDIPLLTEKAVDWFIRQCRQQEGDLFYPVIPLEASEASYPGVRKTYVKLRDGTYTGGNLFLVRPEIVRDCFSIGEELINLRKSPLRLSLRIGPGFILRFICRRVSLQEAAGRVSRILGIKGTVIECPFPEIGLDIDKAADLESINRYLKC